MRFPGRRRVPFCKQLLTLAVTFSELDRRVDAKSQRYMPWIRISAIRLLPQLLSAGLNELRVLGIELQPDRPTLTIAVLDDVQAPAGTYPTRRLPDGRAPIAGVKNGFNQSLTAMSVALICLTAGLVVLFVVCIRGGTPAGGPALPVYFSGKNAIAVNLYFSGTYDFSAPCF
jgi:hypothetical protein